MSTAIPRTTPAVNETAPAAPAGVTYHRIARYTDPASATEQREIAEQREAAERIAARLGVPIVEEFIDVGISGTTTDRPGLRRMLELVQTGRITHCVVDHRYRLARTVADTIAIEQELKRNGVSVVSADDATPDFVRSLVAAISAEEERQHPATLSGRK